MSHHRRFGVISGAALLLLLTATACSTNRTTVGELTFRAANSPAELTYSNTSVNGCTPILLPRGAAHVHNNTLVDVILYRTPNCQTFSGAEGTYVGTTLSDVTAQGTLPWRSFSVVH
ncbi:hypothetical protein [Streptomyces sp. NRRL S-87]|uniref:hypothetical protein n=1 Tax=Streptomyces sp. NRRL S-87 TaxID=1463920 RepID=UPI0004BF6851|nr:hypothetical protein [Streptomyces sp. NRRL S-87]